MTPSLTDHLEAHKKLNRLLQDALNPDGTDLFGDQKLQHEAYSLGIDVGAGEALRFVLPRLAEHMPLGSPELRRLVNDVRTALRELEGYGLDLDAQRIFDQDGNPED